MVRPARCVSGNTQFKAIFVMIFAVDATLNLYRPVGKAELELIRESGFTW